MSITITPLWDSIPISMEFGSSLTSILVFEHSSYIFDVLNDKYHISIYKQHKNIIFEILVLGIKFTL